MNERELKNWYLTKFPARFCLSQHVLSHEMLLISSVFLAHSLYLIPGSVISNGFGSVLKQYSAHEARCLRELQSDRLSSYVPTYQGDVMFNGKCILFGSHSQ